jgi:hypothetical protein
MIPSFLVVSRFGRPWIRLLEGSIPAISRYSGRFRAVCSIQYPQVSAHQPRVRQRRQHLHRRRVLWQTPLAHLEVAGLPLDYWEWMGDFKSGVQQPLQWMEVEV